MKAKETKKFGLDLFQKVDFKPGNSKSDVLIFLCAIVFTFFYFSSVIFLDAYGRKERRSASSEKYQMQISKNVLAAEDQKNENSADAEGNIFLEGDRVSEAMSEATGSVKNLANKIIMARKLSRQRAAFAARIRSGPLPTGPTIGLSDGRRFCDPKNDHPQGGGKVHVDEDCCPDPNETPNPRCYYTPGQLKIMQ